MKKVILLALFVLMLLSLFVLMLLPLVSAETVFDDFNRPNNSTVGNGWSEVSNPGDLSIYSNTLKIENSNSQDRAQLVKSYNATNPRNVSFRVKIDSSGSGSEAAITFALRDSSDNIVLYFGMSFDTSGIFFHSGDSAHTVSASTDTYYNLSMRNINFTEATFDAYIDGSLSASNLSFFGTPADINDFFIGTGGGNDSNREIYGSIDWITYETNESSAEKEWADTGWVEIDEYKTTVPVKYLYGGLANFGDQSLSYFESGSDTNDRYGYSWDGNSWITNNSIKILDPVEYLYGGDTFFLNGEPYYITVVRGSSAKVKSYQYKNGAVSVNDSFYNDITENNQTLNGLNVSLSTYYDSITNINIGSDMFLVYIPAGTAPFQGFKWNGSGWNPNSSITNNLRDSLSINNNEYAEVLNHVQIDGENYLIEFHYEDTWRSSRWNGSGWVRDDQGAANLNNIAFYNNLSYYNTTSNKKSLTSFKDPNNETIIASMINADNDEDYDVHFYKLDTYPVEPTINTTNRNFTTNDIISINGTASDTTLKNITINSTDFINVGNITHFDFQNITTIGVGDYNYNLNATDYDGLSTSVEVNISVFSGDSSINIITVNNGGAITLTSNDNTSQNFSFVVSDLSGVDALNDSTATMNLTKTGETSLINDSCISNDINTTATNYTCTFSLPYYTAPGEWNLGTYVENNESINVTNTTETVTVNTLDALDYSNTISWTSLETGTNNNEGGPITFTNYGNNDYSTVKFTAYDAINGSNKISAGNYSMAVSTGQCPGYQATNATEVTILDSSLSRGANATEVLYPCVNVPDIPSGTYNSENNWVISFS